MYEVNANLVNIVHNIDWCLVRGRVAQKCESGEEMQQVRKAALVVIRYLYPDHPILNE